MATLKRAWLPLFLCCLALVISGCASGGSRYVKAPSPGYRGASTGGMPSRDVPQATTVSARTESMDSSGEEGWDDEGGGGGDVATVNEVGPPPAPPPQDPSVMHKVPQAKGDKKGKEGRTDDGQPSGGGEPLHDTAMLIYTAHLTMAVYQVGPALDAVERIGKEVGGYLSIKTDHDITIRVPRGRFDEALKRVETSGDVIHRDVSAQDVTDEFMDLEVRLKNARAMRDRLQQLLTKAAVKEALDIEKELGRITGEIESMEGKLKLLRDKIAYSTIQVSFQGRGEAAVRDMPIRLPFPWLSNMGLPRLLNLSTY